MGLRISEIGADAMLYANILGVGMLFDAAGIRNDLFYLAGIFSDSSGRAGGGGNGEAPP